jgi:pyruvate kinase
MNTNYIKKTKIIATIWPSTRNEDMILKLYKAWVNVLRFNFSHADYENATKVWNIVKEFNKNNKTKLWLMLDTKGPEIRTWDYEGLKSYQTGDIFNIYVDKTKVSQNSKDQFCDYPYLLDDIEVGWIIKIESWLFDVVVQEKKDDYVIVQALHSIEIKQRRHINLPGIRLKLPWLMEQDKKDVLFAIEQWFDYIAMSFVRNKDNIQECRNFLDSHGGENIHIISKIENQEAIDNYEEIVEYSDGVMVARGDLWIEVPIENLPIYQQQIIESCRNKGKYVIVATHLLESMIENPFPTRAEVSDIFNAITQKTDAIMLSWETTIGKYPIQAVEMMKSIALKAESLLDYTPEEFHNNHFTESDNEKKCLIRSAISIADKLNINSIIVFTKTGRLAKIAAAYKSKIKIYAFTNKESTVTNSTLLFWVKSRYLPYEHHTQALEDALQTMIRMKDINSNEKIIVITDIKKDNYETPTLEIIHVDRFLGM